MRFPFRELHGFEDAQRNFEFLESLLARSTAFGTGTFTGNGTATVQFSQPHGLSAASGVSTTPRFAVAFPIGFAGSLEEYQAPDATNIFLQAFGMTFVNLTVYTYHWLAIG